MSQFLSEMDGFAQDNQGVLVLGATNVPWAIDPAFRRPGRFDRMLFVAAARPGGARGHLPHPAARPSGRAGDIDAGVAPLARRTATFSGADLANVVETAADLAIARSLAAGARERRSRDEDLEHALGEVQAAPRSSG